MTVVCIIWYAFSTVLLFSQLAERERESESDVQHSSLTFHFSLSLSLWRSASSIAELYISTELCSYHRHKTLLYNTFVYPLTYKENCCCALTDYNKIWYIKRTDCYHVARPQLCKICVGTLSWGSEGCRVGTVCFLSIPDYDTVLVSLLRYSVGETLYTHWTIDTLTSSCDKYKTRQCLNVFVVLLELCQINTSAAFLNISLWLYNSLHWLYPRTTKNANFRWFINLSNVEITLLVELI